MTDADIVKATDQNMLESKTESDQKCTQGDHSAGQIGEQDADIVVQGPFTAQNMIDWVSAGYFLGEGDAVQCECVHSCMCVCVCVSNRLGVCGIFPR
jgi:hypothetical protein